jgi:hypothetical protein
MTGAFPSQANPSGVHLGRVGPYQGRNVDGRLSFLHLRVLTVSRFAGLNPQRGID